VFLKGIGKKVLTDSLYTADFAGSVKEKQAGMF